MSQGNSGGTGDGYRTSLGEGAHPSGLGPSSGGGGAPPSLMKARIDAREAAARKLQDLDKEVADVRTKLAKKHPRPAVDDSLAARDAEPPGESRGPRLA